MKQGEVPKLLIDTREKPPDVVKAIQQMVGEGRSMVTTLSAGDYAIGTTVVERKRPGDLVSALVKRMENGKRRLFDQLERCLAQYERVLLIIEGPPVEATGNIGEVVAQGRLRRVPYLSVQAALLKAQAMGVQVVWTAGVAETALLLNYLLRGGVTKRDAEKP